MASLALQQSSLSSGCHCLAGATKSPQALGKAAATRLAPGSNGLGRCAESICGSRMQLLRGTGQCKGEKERRSGRVQAELRKEQSRQYELFKEYESIPGRGGLLGERQKENPALPKDPNSKAGFVQVPAVRPELQADKMGIGCNAMQAANASRSWHETRNL
jgi:hypothetical protein